MSAFSVVNAPPARALDAGCEESVIQVQDSSAFALVNVYRDCADGSSYVDGEVMDTECDDREARLTLSYYNSDAFINDNFPLWAYRVEEPKASGCGATTEFAYSSTNPRPEIHACVIAASWFNKSVGECSWAY